MTMLPDICIPLSALRTSLTLWRPSPFETGGTSILTRNEHFIVDILFVKSNEPLVTWVKTFQMFCFWMNQSRYLYYHCGLLQKGNKKCKKLKNKRGNRQPLFVMHCQLLLLSKQTVCIHGCVSIDILCPDLSPLCCTRVACLLARLDTCRDT